MNVENQDQQIKEIENIISLIALKRKHGDSAMEVYVKFISTIEHLQKLGYDISEVERGYVTKIIIGW